MNLPKTFAASKKLVSPVTLISSASNPRSNRKAVNFLAYIDDFLPGSVALFAHAAPRTATQRA